MEYASKGELYDYISERRRLSERETRHFFRQIVSAVHHCHKVRKSPTVALGQCRLFQAEAPTCGRPRSWLTCRPSTRRAGRCLLLLRGHLFLSEDGTHAGFIPSPALISLLRVGPAVMLSVSFRHADGCPQIPLKPFPQEPQPPPPSPPVLHLINNNQNISACLRDPPPIHFLSAVMSWTSDRSVLCIHES